VAGRGMSKAPDQNRKYQRRASLQQAHADVIHLRVMIMDRKTNKITQAYTFTGVFFGVVLQIKHFIGTMRAEKFVVKSLHYFQNCNQFLNTFHTV
jgi:hypothetical protein